MIVTIPSCGESAHIGKLLTSCTAAGVRAYVAMNNVDSDQSQFLHAAVEEYGGVLVDMGNDIGLYSVWNKCLDLTKGNAAGAILNDDIYVHPDSFARIEKSVQETHGVVGWDAWAEVAPHPGTELRRVYGTYRTHGLAGFAFAFDPSTAPRFDERYTWWYGDDDWVAQVMKDGVPLNVEAQCGVKHHPSTSQRARPWVASSVKDDERMFGNKWA